MKRVMRQGAMMLGLLAVAACAAPNPNAAAIATVKPHETTYDQVVATFGLPSSEVVLTGDGKMVLYDLPEYDRNAYQQVPYLNLTQNNYDALAYDYFIFNRDGVLESFSIPHFAARAGIANPGT